MGIGLDRPAGGTRPWLRTIAQLCASREGQGGRRFDQADQPVLPTGPDHHVPAVAPRPGTETVSRPPAWRTCRTPDHSGSSSRKCLPWPARRQLVLRLGRAVREVLNSQRGPAEHRPACRGVASLSLAPSGGECVPDDSAGGFGAGRSCHARHLDHTVTAQGANYAS